MIIKNIIRNNLIFIFHGFVEIFRHMCHVILVQCKSFRIYFDPFWMVIYQFILSRSCVRYVDIYFLTSVGILTNKCKRRLENNKQQLFCSIETKGSTRIIQSLRELPSCFSVSNSLCFSCKVTSLNKTIDHFDFTSMFNVFAQCKWQVIFYV